MKAYNPHTGAPLISKPSTKAYADNFDLIFRKPKEPEPEAPKEPADVDSSDASA
jgi:hypothetical protein